MADALDELIQAIGEIDDKIKRCVLSMENPVIRLKAQVDQSINSALATIDNVQGQITTIINVPGTIKTNSVRDFVNSVDSGFATIEQASITLVNTPNLSNIQIPLVSGTPTVGQSVTASEGEWNTPPSEYQYQWFRVKGGVKSELYNTSTPSYTITAEDSGAQLYAVVTAINTIDSESIQTGMVTVT